MAVNLSQLDGANGFRIDGIDKWDQTGFAVSGAGDVNGDGLDDLMLGGFGVNQRAGGTYGIFGKKAGCTASFDLTTLDGSNGFRLKGVKPDDSSGVAIDGAGDVNGDGLDDLIIGADTADVDGKDRAGQGYLSSAQRPASRRASNFRRSTGRTASASAGSSPATAPAGRSTERVTSRATASTT